MSSLFYLYSDVFYSYVYDNNLQKKNILFILKQMTKISECCGITAIHTNCYYDT